MAKGRMLSVELSMDVKLSAVSVEAQLLYVMAQPHLDRDGLIEGEPRLLVLKALPLRPAICAVADRLVMELEEAGLLWLYDGFNGRVAYFRRFRLDNANLRYEREERSKYPPPPGWVRQPWGMMPEIEEERLAMIHMLDPRCNYYKNLLTTLSDESRKIVLDVSGIDPGGVPLEGQGQGQVDAANDDGHLDFSSLLVRDLDLDRSHDRDPRAIARGSRSWEPRRKRRRGECCCPNRIV